MGLKTMIELTIPLFLVIAGVTGIIRAIEKNDSLLGGASIIFSLLGYFYTLPSLFHLYTN